MSSSYLGLIAVSKAAKKVYICFWHKTAIDA